MLFRCLLLLMLLLYLFSFVLISSPLSSIVLISHPLFSFVFISDKNFIFSSKDTVATTVALELIIRTIFFSLLLILKRCILLMGPISPVKYYREVFNSAMKDLSQWSWHRLEMRLSNLLSANYSENSAKSNNNETNTFQINKKNTNVTSNIAALVRCLYSELRTQSMHQHIAQFRQAYVLQPHKLIQPLTYFLSKFVTYTNSQPYLPPS